jgi:hypothetical protein
VTSDEWQVTSEGDFQPCEHSPDLGSYQQQLCPIASTEGTYSHGQQQLSLDLPQRAKRDADMTAELAASVPSNTFGDVGGN